MDGGHRLDSSMGDGNWLDFSPGFGIYLIFVGVEMTWILCGGRKRNMDVSRSK